MLLSALTPVPAVLAAQSPCPEGRLPAYAHNDYTNPQPLTDALALGYRGVEADVFLRDGVLRLGHDRRGARTGAAFETRYLVPLAALIARCGALTTADGAAFLLTVELKEASRVAYDSLVAALARHPMVPATLDVVLVGWHPGAEVVAAAPVRLGRQHRLRSPEPPLGALGPGVRLVSLDYGKTVGRRWGRAAGQRRWMETLRRVRTAHPALRLRVHNVPVDATVYRTLLTAGVELIGARELPTTARLLDGEGVR